MPSSGMPTWRYVTLVAVSVADPGVEVGGHVGGAGPPHPPGGVDRIGERLPHASRLGRNVSRNDGLCPVDDLYAYARTLAVWSSTPAMVVDLSGSGLGRDLFSAELLPLGIAPMAPKPTAPEGTVQHLAETAVWDPESDHPWRVLANVHGYLGSHFFADRLLLPADGWAMLSISERLVDGCYAIESAYSFVGDGLTRGRLYQVEPGCEVPLGWTIVESNADWTVAAADPDRFDLPGALQWFANATPRNPSERPEVARYYP